MNWDHMIVIMRYGEAWQYHRKICQQIFRKAVVKDSHGIMSQKVHAMLNGLLESPEKFEQHIKVYANLINH
jgi:cytochrome P450